MMAECYDGNMQTDLLLGRITHDVINSPSLPTSLPPHRYSPSIPPPIPPHLPITSYYMQQATTYNTNTHNYTHVDTINTGPPQEHIPYSSSAESATDEEEDDDDDDEDDQDNTGDTDFSRSVEELNQSYNPGAVPGVDVKPGAVPGMDVKPVVSCDDWLESERQTEQTTVSHADTQHTQHADIPLLSMKQEQTPSPFLTPERTYEICQFKTQHPDIGPADIAAHFNTLWSIDLTAEVVEEIVSASDNVLCPVTLEEAQLSLRKVISYLECKPDVGEKDLRTLWKLLSFLYAERDTEEPWEDEGHVSTDSDNVVLLKTKKHKKITRSRKKNTTQPPVQNVGYEHHPATGDSVQNDDIEDSFSTGMTDQNNVNVLPPNQQSDTSGDLQITAPPVNDPDKKHVCLRCGKAFKKRRDLERHTRTHTGEKPYKCHVCGRAFADHSTRRQHIRTHPGAHVYQCDVCDEKFMESSAHREHLKTHQEHKSIECKICQKTFTKQAYLKGHLQTHKGDRPYKCPVCDKGFNDPSTLKQHMRLHTGELPHTCDICGKRFSHSSNYLTHMKAHTGDLPHKCEFCGAGYPFASHLRRHMAKHTGEKIYKYKCLHDDCGKAFTQLCNLQAHDRTHTGDKPFQCSTCGKVFNHSGSLTIHMRTHTGERPYKCSHCDKSFTHAVSLQTHVRTHTGEKPYVCSTCGKGFAQSGTFRRHTRLHTGEKPHACTTCGARFTIKSNLNKHMKVHGIDDWRLAEMSQGPVITAPPSELGEQPVVSQAPPIVDTSMNMAPQISTPEGSTAQSAYTRPDVNYPAMGWFPYRPPLQQF